MASTTYDQNELKRRMQGAISVLKQELGALRTGRASAHLLDQVHVDAYGQNMPLIQLATVSVPQPRMRIPIAHCLAWPTRIDGPAARLDLARVGTLNFEDPDPIRFPALALGRQALETGGAAPTILNAANEIAVAAFLGRRLGFGGITALVEATLDAAVRRNAVAEPQDIDEAVAVDHMARSLAQDLLPEIAAKSF